MAEQRRRIFAYSSVAQAGYIAIAFVVVGAAGGTGQQLNLRLQQITGIAGGLLLILGHALMKTGAFIGTASGGLQVLREGKTDPDDISSYAGLS